MRLLVLVLVVFASARLNGCSLGMEVFRRQPFKEKNFAVSPLSLGGALSLALAGATNKAKTLLEATLGCNVEQCAQHMKSSTSSALAMSSRVFCSNLLTPDNAFVENVRLFGSEVCTAVCLCVLFFFFFIFVQITRLDFHATGSAEKINGWASEVTHGMIPTITSEEELLRELDLMIFSVLYFKAKWEHSFEKSDPIRFAKSIKLYPSMHYLGRLRYGSDEGVAELVEVPYADSRLCHVSFLFCFSHGLCVFSFVMLFVVPVDGVAVSDLTIDLDYWLPLLTHRRVSLTVPKFKQFSSIDATETLQNIGLRPLFAPGAFQSISPHVFVSQIVQQVAVEVDEKGTEAAAVTKVSMMHMARLKGNPVRLIINKPFLYFLRNRDNGNVVLAGYIFEPKQ